MSSFQIFDSLTRRKQALQPIVPGKITIYLCGPTVQGSPHIGHARSAVAFDVVRRALAWTGLVVTFARNVTDVDDKIIARAAAENIAPDEVARRHADEYRREMAAVGCLPPTIEPHVTRSMDAIIALVAELVRDEQAYAAGGDVYYAVEKNPEYGRLSGQPISELVAGARVEVGELKRAPLDFALWKAAKPGEPSWESPWGRGRPGWHIECSAMIRSQLGDEIDIHGGGKDLLFPHHENELAQGSRARTWMHNGLLNLGGEKMSKSIGNVFAVEELRKKYDGESIRLYLVSHHYRSPLAFDVAGIEDAERRLDYFYSTLARLDAVPDAGATHADHGIRAALEDDFNTPVAIAALGELMKAANKLLDGRQPAPGIARALRRGAEPLGLLARPPIEFLHARRGRLAAARGIDPAAVDARLAERAEARRAKDYARGDAIRDELRALGVEVMDAGKTVDWRLND
jgi:cysteinyl-tRNA synthetase